MAHDVFISYSHRDKTIADAACARLEQAGHRCWIAPRDIAGGEWGKAIVEGIRGARIFVLIFSAHANRSPQVNREVERAVSNGLPIIPFRIEDIAPSGALEYFISNQHWLDALTPPVARHLGRLTDSVERLLGAGTAVPPPPPDETTLPASRAMPIILVTGFAVVVAAAVWTAIQRANLATPDSQASSVQPENGAQAEVNRIEPPASEPQPLEELIDLASIPFADRADGQVDAPYFLQRAIVPLETLSTSPSSARLRFIDSRSVDSLRDSALPQSQLLALMVQGESPTNLVLRLAEPVAEIRLTRPEVETTADARSLQFPAFTVTALDSDGRVLTQAGQPEWTADGFGERAPPRTLILRASGPIGIRAIRIRIEGVIRRPYRPPLVFAPGRIGDPPPPPPPPEPYYAAILLESFAVRRMERPHAQAVR